MVALLRIAPIVGVLAALGCTIAPVDPAGRACDDAHACAAGFSCVAGACEVSCAKDADCPAGRACIAGGCAVVVTADAGAPGGADAGGAGGDAGPGDEDAGTDAGVRDAGVDDPHAPTVDAPAADPAATSHGEAVDVALSGADLDGDTVTFVVVAPPLHGTATGSAGGVAYTPDPGFAGFDAVGVAAFDGVKRSDPVDVEVYTVGRSCAHVLTVGGSRGDGVYLLDPTPDASAPDAGPDAGPDTSGGGDVPVLCDMTDEGGGWSLAMKVDGSRDTFCFSRPAWTDGQTLNDDSVDLSLTEAKLVPFVAVPAGEVLVQMRDLGTGATTSLVAPLRDNGIGDRPLGDVLADGVIVDTNLAPADWAALAAPHGAGDFSPVVEGLNAGRDDASTVRIGASGLVGCCADTAIGVGLRSSACGGVFHASAGFEGVVGCCSAFQDPGFAFVWVRSRDFTFLPPVASCDLDQGRILSGVYEVDPDGPGQSTPQPVSCDFGDFHELVAFDASRQPCPSPLVQNPDGAGCVRGLDAGGPVSLVFPSPVPYREVRVVVEASLSGSPEAFAPSATPGAGLDGVYLDGVSVTTSQTPGGAREHAVSFAAGAGATCPCAGGAAAPAFVGTSFVCDATTPLWNFDALDAACAEHTPQNEADVAVTPGSTGPVEVRLMTDEGRADEDVALLRLELFVR